MVFHFFFERWWNMRKIVVCLFALICGLIITNEASADHARGRGLLGIRGRMQARQSSHSTANVSKEYNSRFDRLFRRGNCGCN